MSIEKPPFIKQADLFSAVIDPPNEQVEKVVSDINSTFDYWDTVKYKECPDGITPTQLWTYVKAARLKSTIMVWKRYGVSLTLTNFMQRMCHEFDMN